MILILIKFILFLSLAIFFIQWISDIIHIIFENIENKFWQIILHIDYIVILLKIMKMH